MYERLHVYVYVLYMYVYMHVFVCTIAQTIIEALRFATTGTAPDTSERGKNFVHDPRVCFGQWVVVLRPSSAQGRMESMSSYLNST
jgi:hypothetical protein